MSYRHDETVMHSQDRRVCLYKISITRLMMDLTVPNMRFTLPNDRPLANRWSRNAAASDEAYAVMGLLPNASTTYLLFRLAA